MTMVDDNNRVPQTGTLGEIGQEGCQMKLTKKKATGWVRWPILRKKNLPGEYLSTCKRKSSKASYKP
jgi:hypothetical protein